MIEVRKTSGAIPLEGKAAIFCLKLVIKKKKQKNINGKINNSKIIWIILVSWQHDKALGIHLLLILIFFASYLWRAPPSQEDGWDPPYFELGNDSMYRHLIAYACPIACTNGTALEAVLHMCSTPQYNSSHNFLHTTESMLTSSIASASVSQKGFKESGWVS